MLVIKGLSHHLISSFIYYLSDHVNLVLLVCVN